MTAPMLLPVMWCGLTPSSSRASSMGMWAIPLAPPGTEGDTDLRLVSFFLLWFF